MEIVFVIAWFFMYFLPSIIAYKRGHASKHSILLWNFLTGWTGVMWIVCFGWAIGNKGGSVIVNVNNNASGGVYGSNDKGD